MSSASSRSSSTVLHPASGLLILGLDWLLFSGSALTLGLSTLALSALGFVVGGLGTGLIQRVYHGDGTAKTILKGLLAGIAVGIPLPIAGTAVGGGVLALSGLNRLWDRPTREDTKIPPSTDDN